MPFEWMKNFQPSAEKPANYAEKTLAAYKLGMKAGGSIRGVRIQLEDDPCAAAQALPAGAVYHPDEAPHLPLPDCPRGGKCRCQYRPVMSYEVETLTPPDSESTSSSPAAGTVAQLAEDQTE